MEKGYPVEEIKQYCLNQEIDAILQEKIIYEDKFGQKRVTGELKLKNENFTEEIKEHFNKVAKFQAAYLECGYRRTKDLAEAFMNENSDPEPSFHIYNAINFGKQSKITIEEVLAFAQRNRRKPVTDTDFTFDTPDFLPPDDSEEKVTLLDLVKNYIYLLRKKF